MKIPRIALICLIALAGCSTDNEEPYDLVILNGRVMDPETEFDAVANVGIRNGIISKVTKDEISGADQRRIRVRRNAFFAVKSTVFSSSTHRIPKFCCPGRGS